MRENAINRRPISTPNETPFWNRTLTDLDSDLGVAHDGLTPDEAQRRLLKFGSNQLNARPVRPLIVQFLSRFRSPLVLLLLGASTVMGITGDLTGCLIIGVIVV